jgi:hypothetical protein
MVPLAQEQFQFFKIKKLNGTFIQYNKPHLTTNNWLNKSYQDTMENYSRLNFGFSSLLTRIHNQYIFQVFGATRSPSVVIGKQNEIYDYGHIQSYLGTDYVGEDVIRNKIQLLDEIQTSLQPFGINLVIVITPSKPSFVPEYLPNEYTRKGGINNYDMYNQLLTKSTLPYINYSSLYHQWKGSEQYPLFPQCGVHWSEYGATLAADSMIHYFEHLRNINLPDMGIDSIVLSENLSESDYDMGSILNLLYPIKAKPMGYPQLKINETTEHKRFNLLSIADSYYWIWFNKVGFNQKFFSNSRFLEYYSKAHLSNGEVKNVKELNIIDEVLASDVILILGSESNLYRMGYGFVEEFHQLIPEVKKIYKTKLNEYKKGIIQDKAWYESIVNKAKQKSISVDSMLTIDAIYLIQHERDK